LLCDPLGLTFNPSKCEWYGGLSHVDIPEPLATAGVKVVSECNKILGAYIGEPAAVRAMLLAKLQKHSCLYRRLMSMDPGPAPYAILVKCLLPRHGYHMRTHCPDDTAELCTAFDDLVLSVARKWFDLSRENDIALKIARLPKRMGGNGLGDTFPIRSFAYNDSFFNSLKRLGRLENDSQKPASQKDATKAHHESIAVAIRALPDSALLRRTLEMNALKGAGGWLDAPTQWMAPSAYAAAWRLRCLAKAASLPEFLSCPGCPKKATMQQVDFAVHAHGCASCPTKNNSTAAHNHLTAYLWKHCSNNAVRATKEPRGFQSYKCPRCHCVMSGADATAKLRAHAHRCGEYAWRQGVDLEVFLNHQRFMVDFTIAHGTSPSHVETKLPLIVAAKKKKKVTRYVDSGLVPANDLLVALAWSCGALHDDFVQFLHLVAGECRTDYADLVAGVRNCVIWGQGAAVDAAFRVAASSLGSRRDGRLM